MVPFISSLPSHQPHQLHEARPLMLHCTVKETKTYKTKAPKGKGQAGIHILASPWVFLQYNSSFKNGDRGPPNRGLSYFTQVESEPTPAAYHNCLVQQTEPRNVTFLIEQESHGKARGSRLQELTLAIFLLCIACILTFCILLQSGCSITKHHVLSLGREKKLGRKKKKNSPKFCLFI